MSDTQHLHTDVNPGAHLAGLIEPVRCSLFYRYVRLEFLVHIPDRSITTRLTSDRPTTRSNPACHAELLLQGTRPPQASAIKPDDGGENVVVSIDALIEDPMLFPHAATLIVTMGDVTHEIDITAFTELCSRRNGLGSLDRSALIEAIGEFDAARHGRRPRLLDLGGRRRSGHSYSSDLTQCDVTVFDIVADESVDVVGDAHRLSRHFPPAYFDFVLSVSVFEHLLMPWKVAIELNQVMSNGGVCYIHTHQSLGMHELPWDFWRYSDTAWHGIFNVSTGFEILKTGIGKFTHLVTASWGTEYRGSEQSGGFENSGVLVRKIGPTDLEWNIELGDIVKTHYPQSAM